ncbi:MAG: GtrA family protein [Coriobacteriia bacterium]|nr:GtrA family protein [Coriobacteriia bacterium]
MRSLTEKLLGAYDNHAEKLRYLAVGVVNTAFSYGLFWVSIRFLAGPLESSTSFDSKVVAIGLQWAVWIVAVVWSTTTMKYLVFRSAGSLGSQIPRAYFVYLPAQGLSSLILFVAMQFLGLGALVGQLLAIFITTIFSYFGHKYFTFRVPLEVGEVPEENLLSPKMPRGSR